MAHKRNSVEVPELEKLLAGKKKKYVRYEEGAVLYSMGKNSFRQVAQDAHAIVRLKRIALVNVEVLDEYIDDTVSGFFSFMHMVITEMFLSAGQRSTSRLSRFDSEQHPLSRFPSRSIKKGP